MKSGKSSEKNKKPNEDNRSGDDTKSTRPTLPDFMFGVNALFHEVEEDQRKKLARYLIAYPFLYESQSVSQSLFKHGKIHQEFKKLKIT